ncbi:MAG: nucleoside-diphosphate kinase [Thermodesulfobacteriota bacterium]
MELTLAIIKPDAVANGYTGRILDRIIQEGFTIAALKMVHLTEAQAQGFYAVHQGRPFFGSLTKFMSTGPIIVMVLSAEGAIARWRTVMGATDPAEAAEGTLRRLYAENKERNACHGSDAPETAAFEIGYFFNAFEIFGR